MVPPKKGGHFRMQHESIERVKQRINEAVVQSRYPEEPFHAINTLEWVLKLNPEAGEALQVAALGHDIERSFEEKRVHPEDFRTYDEYKQAHALNSAQILTCIMEEEGVVQEFVDDVAHIVAHHESGGSAREELLKNANTISFFHVCLPLYYDRKGEEIARKRCVWGYKKLPPELREIVTEFDYMDDNIKALVHETLSLE